MKTNKTTIILLSLLVVSILIGGYSFNKTQKLRRDLKEVQSRETVLTTQIDAQKKIQSIDELLVKGQYGAALKAYNHEISAKPADIPEDLKLRVTLAKKMILFSSNKKILDSITKNKTELDSSEVKAPVVTTEIRQYDSLSFALKKAKVQLGRMKRRLKNSSSGAYLTFKNTKKHQLHYVGQVSNKKANGYGIAVLDTGSRYEGEWQDNQRHGEGVFYWIDGQKYTGSYQNDRRSGMGTYYWPNGEKYVGQWKNDQRDGEGVFYAKDKSVIARGIWKNDKLVEELKSKK